MTASIRADLRRTKAQRASVASPPSYGGLVSAGIGDP